MPTTYNAAKRRMPTHKLKRITSVTDRVVFSGPIPAGVGEHDYVCSKCGSLVLRQVGVRHPSSAVFECGDCGTLNVVSDPVTVSDEVAERLVRWFGPSADRFAKERRKSSR